MAKNALQILTAEIVDDEAEITLIQLCQTCEIGAETVEAMVEQGILEPLGRRGCHWCFPSNSLRRARVVLRLQRDLGVNLAGAALALELLERIDALHARLRAVGG